MSAQPEDARQILFGEEVGGEPPLAALLADVQRHLRALAQQYRGTRSPDEQFEILDEALDELDAALDRVREARVKLARIEMRLATAYENAVARIREAERDAGTG